MLSEPHYPTPNKPAHTNSVSHTDAEPVTDTVADTVAVSISFADTKTIVSTNTYANSVAHTSAKLFSFVAIPDPCPHTVCYLQAPQPRWRHIPSDLYMCSRYPLLQR